MVILGAGFGAGGSGSRDGAGGSPAHEPAVSHVVAMAFASSQLVLPVYLRLKVPLRVPDAKIKQPQRFHPFLRSSNSPERDSSGCPPSHSSRWRR